MTTENQLHTPGPWLAFYEYSNGPLHVGASKNCLVAGIYIPPVGNPVANSSLIAAAPELLEALRGMLSLDEAHQRGHADEDVCAEVRAARAAIAKATGANHE